VRRAHRSSSSIRHVYGRGPDFESPFCPGPCWWTRQTDRSVNHHIFEIWIVRERLEHAFPHALLRLTPEARVDGEPFAEFDWQIAPGRASAGNPQNRFHKQSIVLRALSRIAQFSRHFPFNARVSFVVQTCPNQSWLPSLPALNQIFPSGCKHALICQLYRRRFAPQSVFCRSFC
jgi:hypothetical protein